jgi:hypothetical protein
MGPVADTTLRMELARSRVEALTRSAATTRIGEGRPARPALTVLRGLRRRRACPGCLEQHTGAHAAG